MTIEEALVSAPLPRGESELLAAHVAGADRTWVMAHATDEWPDRSAHAFRALVLRRRAGEPLAYITGKRAFFGREFIVSPDVLVPRPCTEALVSDTLAILSGQPYEPVREIDTAIAVAANVWGDIDRCTTIVDVGTGSGCIAISIACEQTERRCIGIDTSQQALMVAQENARRQQVEERTSFFCGNALEPLLDFREHFFVVTNPPYVAEEALLADDVRMYEPRTALMGGGEDGATILRTIVSQARNHPYCHGMVAECLLSQASIVTHPDARPT